MDTTIAIVGISNFAARADHKHCIVTGVPVDVGSSNVAGTSIALARADHVHSHGQQTNPDQHATVTTLSNGLIVRWINSSWMGYLREGELAYLPHHQ